MALCEPRVIFDASPKWPASGHRFNRRHAYRISHARLQAANKLFNSRARLARGADLVAITALLHRAELRPAFSPTISWTLATSRDG
jgi:hypothetical protein